LVVGISGSTRRGGNTELLLDAALKGARSEKAQVEKIVLGELDIRPCQGCAGCDDDGVCILSDGMDDIYDLLDSLDVLILASPIYFDGLTAQTKAMIDRSQALWVRKYQMREPAGHGKKRVGAFISAGGREKSTFSNAIGVVKTFFVTINVKYAGEITVAGVDAKGDILQHPQALARSEELGGKLVRMMEGQ